MPMLYLAAACGVVRAYELVWKRGAEPRSLYSVGTELRTQKSALLAKVN